MSNKLLTLLLLASLTTYSQVGIGTTNPQAKLDIASSSATTPTNTDGILIPRINNFPVTNPAASQHGMLVFATGVGIPAKGFYYWNQPALSWIPIGGNSGVKKVDDLLDGKSDNDGTQNGSSVFLGIDAGLNDDSTDNKNVGVGYQNLGSNTTGSFNSATGHQALMSNTTGNNNVANGFQVLAFNTTGFDNTANGFQSLFSNTSGSANVTNGSQTLLNNTTGYYNTAIGSSSLLTNTVGFHNTATGALSLTNNVGSHNTATGSESLSSNTTGYYNTANGRLALSNNKSGYYNTGVGYLVLLRNVTGIYNTAIGYNSGSNYTSLVNATALGSNVFNTAPNQVRVGSTTVTSIGGFRPWSVFSDRRFKKNIKEDVKGLDFILKLRPVTYSVDIQQVDKFLKIPDSISNGKNGELIKFKKESEKEVLSGFIAQEVEQITKLVNYEFSGIDKPKNSNDYYGLRYAEFVVPLVKAMQEQQKIITTQKNKLELLNQRLNKLENLIKNNK